MYSAFAVWDTLNSHRVASPLERWEAPDHPQGFLPQNWGETELNRSVTYESICSGHHHIVRVDISGAANKPIAGLKTKPEQPDEEATYKEKLDLQLRKDRCFTLIYTNISSDLKNLITETTDGVAAWKILKDHFEPVTKARVIQLLDQFFGTKYQPGEDVGILISRVKTAATRLQEAGHKLDDLYIGFQLIRWLPQEFQSTVQQIYRWKEEDFRVVKIEAELILEANRLQLMKQDLEKAENAYLSSFTSKKLKTLPGATAAAHGDPNGKNDYQKKGGKVFNCKTIKNVKQSIKTIGPCYVCNKYGHLKVNCKEKKSLQKSPSTVNETFNTEFNINLRFCEAECSLLKLDKQLVTSCILFEENSDKGVWVIDTAATSHFCNDKSLFLDLKPITNMKMSLATEDKSCPVEGIGTLRFRVKYKGSFHEITLTDVLFNPKLRRNLLSGSRLESKGAHFVGTKGKINVFNKDWIKLFSATRHENLYFFKPDHYIIPKSKEIRFFSDVTAETKNGSIEIWHQRFCHVNNDYLVKTSKNDSVKGLPRLTDNGKTHCIPCKLTKSKRVSFKKTGAVRSKRPLELLHMDLCGPMPTESQGGNKYFLSIIDDYSRKVTVFPIRNKSDVFHTFIRFQKRAERFLSKKVIAVRTDGGLEFCNKDMDNFLTELGIKHEVTNSYTPEMNGVAERFNLTALDGIKTLLKSSEVPHKFWGEALLCFAYTWNRICHKDSNKTPFEKYSGRKPSELHLKPFGCLAYAGVPKQIRKKFDMRAKMGIMMGYAQRTKGYRIWLINENKLVETIYVRFDENKRGINFRQKVNSNLVYNLNLPDYYDDEDDFDIVKDSLTSRLVLKTSTETPSTSEKPDVSFDNHSFIPCTEVKWIRNIGRKVTGSNVYYSIEGEATRLKSYNEIERYCKRHNIEYDPSLFNFRKDNTESQGISDLSEQQEALMVEVTIPNCYKQSIRSRDASKWHDAMDKEINVMMERKVWDLVDHPDNIKILENRWVYTIKYDENNKIVRYKARLVARGNTQLRGESFDEVFSPVINFTIKNFDLKIMGKTKKLLGIEFEEIGNSLFIHQRSYIRRLCEIYEKYKYPVSSLPISKGQVLAKLDSPKTSEGTLTVPYSNLIGSLSFIAIRTRPKIMYAVNVLSQIQANPGIKHWNCFLRLLGYLKYTQEYKLELSKVKSLKLRCYSDSDFATNRDDRVSMGGFITFIDETPAAFKKKSVSLSTMEAEYVSLTEAAKEFIWLKNLINNKSLNLELSENVMFCDNQAAISFSKSPVENYRTKHIDVRYHFLRNLIYDKVFQIKNIGTKNNLADIFTKPMESSPTNEQRKEDNENQDQRLVAHFIEKIV
ncbi:retrovirus-related Pol polyprotein from transposon TNT 1-94 [Trichonephila clavipes]|uniref:Retrovirus-related Pol polyprotein from transposon TNT 1-94 n=1 Tax=Trichonephila clavipes TaxID=2585209 RepID=A0A8X6RDU9_TRICX|nr:retrovirus-related Pol polyprotein from transposon TNT 1-94 [Trichonephila clavipes]